MKVALINLAYKGSKVKSLPLGMALIVHYLRENGHETLILDAECSKLGIDEVYEWCQENPADFIAINSTSYSRFDAVDLARSLKKDGVRWVVLGGHHYSHMPTETLQQYPFVDFIISGPAENPLLRLCNALEKEKTFEHIPGLSYRVDDRIVTIPVMVKDDLIKEPERLPFELFDISSYSTYDELLFLYSDTHRQNIEQGRTITYFLSRGCPYNCYFCANVRYWRSVCFRRIDYTISEVASLKEKYGITHFIMIDPSFTLDRAYTTEFCQRLIQERLDIKFFCSTRVNLIDESLLDLLVQAGLHCIQFGIESGSQRVLDGISKRIRLDDVREKVQICLKKGLIVKGYFMFGHPGETESDILKTINFAKEIYNKAEGRFVPVSMFTDIYPGSKLEKIALGNGRLDKDFSWFERREYPQNKKINMGWTMVPIYEDQDCKIERILDHTYKGFPELLNRELYKGYDQVYRKRHS